MPGVDLTQEQLFFISFARAWCGSARPELALRQVFSGNIGCINAFAQNVYICYHDVVFITSSSLPFFGRSPQPWSVSSQGCPYEYARVRQRI